MPHYGPFLKTHQSGSMGMSQCRLPPGAQAPISIVLAGRIAYKRGLGALAFTVTMSKTKTPKKKKKKKKKAAKKIAVRIRIVPLEKVPIPDPKKK